MITEIEHPDGTKLVPFEGGWKVEATLEKGKWYKTPKLGKALFYLTKITKYEYYAYGFDYTGKWKNEERFGDLFPIEERELASEEEVKEALIKEAKCRGYKNGVKYMCYDTVQEIKNMDGMEYCEVGILTDGYGGHIYSNGEWSKIISNPNEKILERIATIERELEQLKAELK